MLHPHSELRFVSEAIGYGVFATRFIPRGTITWVRDDLDQVIPPARVAAMTGMQADMIAKYGFHDWQGNVVLCWDHGRYVNHHCAPTSLSPGYDFEIAVRDVAPGEEITDDYGTLNLDVEFPCLCGAPQCRRVIRPDDVFDMADGWDRQVRAAFPLLNQVSQPLWELVREKDIVQDVLNGRAEPASCRSNFRRLRLVSNNGATTVSTTLPEPAAPLWNCDALEKRA